MLPALPYTHVVITFGKTRHFITAMENSRLLTIGNGVLVKLGESTINTSTIAEILSLQDFYNATPDERPSNLQDFNAPPVPYVPFEKRAESNRFRLHGLLIGLKSYADKNPNGHIPKMLAGKIKEYERLYGPFDGTATLDEQFELEKIASSSAVGTAGQW